MLDKESKLVPESCSRVDGYKFSLPSGMELAGD